MPRSETHEDRRLRRVKSLARRNAKEREVLALPTITLSSKPTNRIGPGRKTVFTYHKAAMKSHFGKPETYVKKAKGNSL